MAEPEPPRTPDTRAAGTASWLAAPPLDVPAVAGTAPYPLDHTASFAPAPPDAATVSFGGDPTDPAPPPDLPQIPGFHMLGVLGDGGMGTVFKARHLATNRLVALKLIKGGWARDNDFRARFAREAKTQANLAHPNIVPIYDAGSWSGLPYLTMKFVAGKTLYHHLERLRRDLPAAARLLAKVARAVGYLHSKGIVHRDLKPLNILLDTNDEPLVADFGLVRPTDADDDAGLSISLVPLGTRQYMSPEQTLGGRENYTPACDVWALGVILYELLAGYRPYSHEDTAELYRQIRFDPVPPLPARASAPAGLEAVARKCLAKSVGDRYATADAVAADLEKWAAGETIPMPRERTPRRRMRVALAAGALVALLGFSGIPAQPPRETTEPARPVAERLRAGETVWFIGAKGLPQIVGMPGNRVGHVTADADGFCSIGSAEVALIELVPPQELPPCVLELEIAVTNGRGNTRLGAYAGRYEWHSDGRLHQVCFTANVNGPPEVPKQREIPPGCLRAEVFHLHPAEVSPRALTLRIANFEPPPLPFDKPAEWHPLRVDLSGGTIGATRGEHGIPRIPLRDLYTDTMFHLRAVPNAPTDPNTLRGGLGLLVSHGAALFRNVRLVPIAK